MPASKAHNKQAMMKFVLASVNPGKVREIAEIFADDGEPKFRELERQVMKDLLASDQLVIAAGGGAILNAETRSQMKAAGPVAWLTADVDVLAAQYL